MIVKVKLSGRIESLTLETVPSGQAPTFVEGLLRGTRGVVQPFKLTDAERIFLKVEKSDQRPRATVDHESMDREASRDIEQAN